MLNMIDTFNSPGIFKHDLTENVHILIEIWLKFVFTGPTDYNK